MTKRCYNRVWIAKEIGSQSLIFPQAAQGFVLLALTLVLCACGGQVETPKPRAHTATLFARDANNAAVKALEDGDLKTALEKANEAIEDDPEFAMPYYNRALAQALAKQDEEAIQSLTKCVELAPEHAEGQLLLGLLLEHETKISEANTHYAAAKSAFKKVSPALASTELYLGITTYLSDGLAPGLEAMDILVAKYPRNPLLKDVREHMRAGERDFFLTWLTDQQARLEKKQSTSALPKKSKDTPTPGADAAPEKETSDAP